MHCVLYRGNRSDTKMLFITILLFSFSFGNVKSQSENGPIVATKVGTIHGIRANDGNYDMFMGIPFAEVNKSNPFGKATPVTKLEDDFFAIDGSVMCPQLNNGKAVGTLDCLRLNVYVPHSANDTNLLPVMYYIYGGGFQFGCACLSMYGPKFLVRHDVILVTANYRVGPYGFLCLDTPEVPGNQGLKDQLLALRWINDNIESFGGNVNKISLFGESMGGRSIDLHLMSPHEKLYNNVIFQSGTALVRDTFGAADTDAPIRIASQLGFETNDFNHALEFLSKIDHKLVIEASNQLGMYHTACVEKDFSGVEKFVTDFPVNSQVPKVSGIPVLIGYNDNEQVARYFDTPAQYIDDQSVIYERLRNNFDFKSDQLLEMEQIVRHFYLGKKPIDRNAIWELIDFDSDFTYVHTTQRTIERYLENGAGNIFYYVFSYVGGRNYEKHNRNVTVGGVAHADDLGYLFDMAVFGEPLPKDQLIIDRLTTLWTNFAKYDDPTPETTDLLPVKWSPLSKTSYKYLNISSSMSTSAYPFYRRTAFWDLFYKVNWTLQKEHKNMAIKYDE